METIRTFLAGFEWSTIILVLLVAYLAYKNGLPWVSAKAKSLLLAVRGDFYRIEAIVQELKDVIAKLEGNSNVVITPTPTTPTVIVSSAPTSTSNPSTGVMSTTSTPTLSNIGH